MNKLVPNRSIALRNSAAESGKATELIGLLGTLQEAMRSGDWQTALRYADRASRIAPENDEIALFCGEIFLEAGDLDRAFALLSTAFARRHGPDTQAALIRCQLACGLLDEATRSLVDALNNYAVEVNSPLALAAQQLLLRDRSFPGWVGIDSRMNLWGEVFGEGEVRRIEITDADQNLLAGRLAVLPKAGATPFLIGRIEPQTSQTIFVRASEMPLLGNGLQYPPDFRLDGRASIDKGIVSGWVSLGWAPWEKLQLTVQLGRMRRFTVATTPDLADPQRRLFSFKPSFSSLFGDCLTLSGTMPDGSAAALPDSPLLLAPKAFSPTSTRRWFSRAPAPKLRAAAPSAEILIIVPIYQGLEETLGCIDSVLSTMGPDVSLTLVDDACPDPKLSEALTAYAGDIRVNLLRNSVNLGFPGAVNRALKTRGNRDVVILNADAIVFDGWLDRLRNIVSRDASIGTVTPLSNAASIASYPGGEGSPCTREEAEDFAYLAAEINQGYTIELPTGVGFCLYIRSQCLTDTGLLDEEHFAAGYGEENDFCLRARSKGWTHLLTGEVFVQHLGGRSFGSRRVALMERNRRVLNLRHPGYDQQIQKFLAGDPVHEIRLRLDRARLLALSAERGAVLLVSLNLPGGVARFVQERAAAIAEQGLIPLVMKPSRDVVGRVVLTVPDHNFQDLWFDLPAGSTEFERLQRDLNLVQIEIDHFLDIPPAAIDGLIGLDVPIDIFIHDHSWICPRLTLLGGDGRYCGEPHVAECENCIATYGMSLEADLSTQALRERSTRWIAAARTIIVPSADMAQRMNRYFPLREPQIQSWEEVTAAPFVLPRDLEATRIAIIGAIGDQKGYRLLLEAAQDAADRDLPLSFSVIGFTRDDAPLLETGRVFITGRYEEDEIASLLAREQPHLVLFPSVTPESWCYSFSHALRAGLASACLDLGALAERARRSPLPSLILSPDVAAAEMNDLLLQKVEELHLLTPSPLPSNLTAGHGSALLTVEAHDRSSAKLSVTTSPRETMPETRTELTSTVETLTLTKGLYLFTVRAASPSYVGEDSEFILPAVHIGPAPGTAGDLIEFMSGPRNSGSWLCDRKDMLIAKVTGGITTVLLNSIRGPGMAPLSIEVQRLDGKGNTNGPSAEPASTPAEAPAAAPAIMSPSLATQNTILAAGDQKTSKSLSPPDGANLETRQGLRLQVNAHIQNRGDLVFSDTPWSGLIDEKLALESFSITPLEGIGPDQLEYKTLAANGSETSWVVGGTECGTRGRGVSLVGFAIRLKPGTSYDCEYSGAFLSGTLIGPMKNGAPCFVSETDPLVALHLTIKPRQAAIGSPFIASPQKGTPPIADRKDPPRRAGPRFSIFREKA